MIGVTTMTDVEFALHEIRRLQSAKGRIEKENIIARNAGNDTFLKFLYYICHPRMTYKVSESTLLQPAESEKDNISFDTFFDMCELLASRRALDDATVNRVRWFIQSQPEEYRDIYRKILAKTLRLGITAKGVNKVIPDLIPEWEVQQAFPIEKYPIKEGRWFSVSEKLNGVRATVYRGNLIGRSGNIMEGLDHILSQFDHFPNMVFDGELVLKDKGDLSDNEAFRKATGIINSDEDKSEICFRVFDALPVLEFDAGVGITKYSRRRELLDRMMDEFADNPNVRILESLYAGTDQSVIETLLDQMVEQDKEGLMVNLDVTYKCKRHNGILKVKRFYTMDLPILRCEEGEGRLEGTLGRIVVDYMGNEVGVGSGFSDEQRAYFWEHQYELAGTLAEIKYKEVSENKKTGMKSLQFPVFVGLRTDKEEVSYG